MKISLKIFLGYFLLVGLAAWFVLYVFVDEVKPGVRQAMEDSLVDTANVLAELAANDLKNGEIENGQFAQGFAQYQTRATKADIWGVKKQAADYRVYITDDKGMVIFDSAKIGLGQDYSKWNDVYLTLRGKYGVRSSALIPDDTSDKNETIMYVAAPILDGKQIVGSLTVAKPNKTVLPFIERAQFKILRWGALLLVLSLLIGGLFTWRFTRKINALKEYAFKVAKGEKATAPSSSNDELSELANAMRSMRSELAGKAHIQDAIHQLTHELKSPITAIQAASELMSPNMPAAVQAQFLGNIKTQSRRLQHMIQNMLGLAALEQQQQLMHRTRVNLHVLASQQISGLQAKANQQGIKITLNAMQIFYVEGDSFLLGQAINNLLENALDFSPKNSVISVGITQEQQQISLSVQDQGAGIPDYALDKILDKFYSLPRPENTPNAGQKSTGLGLNFVKEIMQLHGGKLEVCNAKEGGAIARLLFQ